MFILIVTKGTHKKNCYRSVNVHKSNVKKSYNLLYFISTKKPYTPNSYFSTNNNDEQYKHGHQRVAAHLCK